MATKKKIEKSIASIYKQIEKHEAKILEGGRKDTTQDYWEKEIARFEEKIREKKRKLEK